MENKKNNKKKRKRDDQNSILNIKRRCVSLKNSFSMDGCKKILSIKQGLCGIHKKRVMLRLPNGSIWENSIGSDKLEDCVQKRLPIRFWEIIECGVCLDKLNQIYKPETLKKLRIEKDKYLVSELVRMGVSGNTINIIGNNRYFWFVNLLYYVGNFQNSIKKIQRFCRGPFQKKLKKRKSAVNTIWKYYLGFKFKKLLPVFIRNYKLLTTSKCINECDPVTQETFMDVSPDRWVICQYDDMDTCWWFDVSSAVQLLGSPGSHAGENPFNRREYPAAFLFDVEEKLHKLKEKYVDVSNLTLSREELKDVNPEEAPTDYYSYKRFKIQIKANKLFESLKESGHFFPRKLFLTYTLGELRILAAKLFESWHTSEELRRIFPDGNVFPLEFTGRIATCSSSIQLKNNILNVLLKSITFQNKYEDRLSGCLKTLVILGTINEESFNVIRENGLGDCIQDDYDNRSPMQILGDLMEQLVNES